MTGGAQASRKSPPTLFNFLKQRTTAPIAALSMVETADKSRINRVCFSSISEFTSLSSKVHSPPQCTLPAIAIAVIPSPISFLVSCMFSLVYSRRVPEEMVSRIALRVQLTGEFAAKILGLRARGKSRGRFAHALEIRNEFIQLGEFQAVIHHRLRARHAQSATGFFQLGQATHQRADGRAVHVRDACHIENHPVLARTDQLIHLLLQSRTFRAAMNAAFDDQRSHARLDLLFCELQDHDAAPSSPSNGNCRIKRTQSPNAAKIELPHPHGTKAAVFWFKDLFASA